MGWYVSTILMPNNVLYVGITDEDYGKEITISEHDTQAQAEEACKRYSKEHNIPMFGGN